MRDSLPPAIIERMKGTPSIRLESPSFIMFSVGKGMSVQSASFWEDCADHGVRNILIPRPLFVHDTARAVQK